MPNTRRPEPVSSEITVASWIEVVEENCPSPELVRPQVGHEIEPVVVIGPPAIGESVEIEVTEPLPPPHAPGSQTKAELDQTIHWLLVAPSCARKLKEIRGAATGVATERTMARSTGLAETGTFQNSCEGEQPAGTEGYKEVTV